MLTAEERNSTKFYTETLSICDPLHETCLTSPLWRIESWRRPEIF